MHRCISRNKYLPSASPTPAPHCTQAGEQSSNLFVRPLATFWGPSCHSASKQTETTQSSKKKLLVLMTSILWVCPSAQNRHRKRPAPRRQPANLSEALRKERPPPQKNQADLSWYKPTRTFTGSGRHQPDPLRSDALISACDGKNAHEVKKAKREVKGWRDERQGAGVETS